MSVRFENLFVHSVAAFKKEQCIVCIYIQNISYLAFYILLFFKIIYALPFRCVTINGTASRKGLLLWRQVYQINFGNIHVSLTTICSKKLSYLYKFIDSQHTGTTIINEWTGVTVLCCNGKSCSVCLWVHFMKTSFHYM